MNMRDKNYKVVILCGGMGTRLKEETEFRPKPLVEIGGRPILWHIMKIYAYYGYKDFVLCLGYKGNMIKEYFMNYECMNNDFTINLGHKRDITFHGSHNEVDWNITLADTGLETNTGGRIKRIEKYIKEPLFLATYGDGVADIDLDALLDYHLEKGKIATITGLHPLSKYGVFEVDGDGLVGSFKEKPRLDDWVSGGFFVFDRRIFDYLDENSILEKEPMERLAREGKMAVYHHKGFWQSMDTFKDAMALNRIWNRGGVPWRIWER